MKKTSKSRTKPSGTSPAPAAEQAPERQPPDPPPIQAPPRPRPVGRGDAEVAWIIVRGAIQRVGRYRSVTFGPATNASIRSLGGWNKVCAASTEMALVMRRDFVRLWLSFVNGPIDPKLAAPLGGLHEGEPPTRVPVPRDEEPAP